MSGKNKKSKKGAGATDSWLPDYQPNDYNKKGKINDDLGSSFAESNFDSDDRSSDYIDDKSDVSGETHSFRPEEGSDTTFSSSDDDDSEDKVKVDKIRVYDARFKIPAQKSIG